MYKYFKAFLVVAVALFSLQGGCSCGGREEPPDAGAECDPAKEFGTTGVVLPGKAPYKLFTSQKEEYGCMGIFWEGQTGSPPSYRTLIKKDGSYLIYNEKTKNWGTNEKVYATVGSGVDFIDIMIFVYKVTAKEATTLNCASLVKGGATGCWKNDQCLFAWKHEKVPMDATAGNGTCRICRREVCDGKDNNCDSAKKADEVDAAGNSACGKVLGTECGYSKDPVTTKTPGCSATSTCSCIIHKDQVYVCAGATSDKVQWMPIAQAAAACTMKGVNDGAKFACGKMALICDECAGKPSWRDMNGSCNDGIMSYKR